MKVKKEEKLNKVGNTLGQIDVVIKMGKLYVFVFSGQPTKVEFHVTVMSLDSINEGSMVNKLPDIAGKKLRCMSICKLAEKGGTEKCDF